MTKLIIVLVSQTQQMKIPEVESMGYGSENGMVGGLEWGGCVGRGSQW